MSRKTDSRTIFEGSKTFWAQGCTLDVTIVENYLFNVLEVCAHVPATQLESRIFLNNSTLISRIDKDLLNENVANAMNDLQRRKITPIHTRVVQEVTNRLKIEYVIERLLVCEYDLEAMIVHLDIQENEEDQGCFLVGKPVGLQLFRPALDSPPAPQIHKKMPSIITEVVTPSASTAQSSVVEGDHSHPEALRRQDALSPLATQSSSTGLATTAVPPATRTTTFQQISSFVAHLVQFAHTNMSGFSLPTLKHKVQPLSDKILNSTTSLRENEVAKKHQKGVKGRTKVYVPTKRYAATSVLHNSTTSTTVSSASSLPRSSGIAALSPREDEEPPSIRGRSLGSGPTAVRRLKPMPSPAKWDVSQQLTLSPPGMLTRAQSQETEMTNTPLSTPTTSLRFIPGVLHGVVDVGIAATTAPLSPSRKGEHSLQSQTSTGSSDRRRSRKMHSPSTLGSNDEVAEIMTPLSLQDQQDMEEAMKVFQNGTCNSSSLSPSHSFLGRRCSFSSPARAVTILEDGMLSPATPGNSFMAADPQTAEQLAAELEEKISRQISMQRSLTEKLNGVRGESNKSPSNNNLFPGEVTTPNSRTSKSRRKSVMQANIQ